MAKFRHHLLFCIFQLTDLHQSHTVGKVWWRHRLQHWLVFIRKWISICLTALFVCIILYRLSWQWRKWKERLRFWDCCASSAPEGAQTWIDVLSADCWGRQIAVWIGGMNDGSLFPLHKQPADIQTGIQTAETDKTDNNKRENERLNIYQLISMGAGRVMRAWASTLHQQNVIICKTMMDDECVYMQCVLIRPVGSRLLVHSSHDCGSCPPLSLYCSPLLCI